MEVFRNAEKYSGAAFENRSKWKNEIEQVENGRLQRCGRRLLNNGCYKQRKRTYISVNNKLVLARFKRHQ